MKQRVCKGEVVMWWITSISIILMAMSTQVVAAKPQLKDSVVCHKMAVTTVCDETAWRLGVDAVYLQPLTAGYAQYQDSSVKDMSNRQGGWGWGYQIKAAYAFRTGNSFAANWLHFSNSSTYPQRLLGENPYGDAHFSLKQTYLLDIVDLALTQTAFVGAMTHMTLYGGLQYASMRNNKTQNYVVAAEAETAGIDSIVRYHNADYSGVGPVVGISYQYPFFAGLHAVAHANSSILYGTSRNNKSLVYGPNGYVSQFSYVSKHQLVPGLHAKLGLSYEHALQECLVKASLGYQVIQYFNPFLLAQSNGQVNNINTSLYGPYFGITWVGKN